MQNQLLLLPVVFPAAAAALIFLLPKERLRLSKYLSMAVTVLNALLVLLLVAFPPERSLTFLDLSGELGVSLSLAFSLDGPGRFFAALVALLWPFALLYAFGYMAHDQKQPVFYLFYTLSFGMTCGIAFAGNLLTLYAFYEMLTLCTIPLVMHGYTRAHRHAAVKYAVYSLGGAAFGFMGTMFLLYKTGSTDFVLGGMLSGDTSPLVQLIFLVCFFGFGVKAAIFPLSGWLPTASVAPTPVTALLHAVAVVKAGVFALLRVVYFCFGADMLRETAARQIALGFALFTVVYGSAKALQSGHFKRRLAWSTVANLSYIASALLLCSPEGMYAALFHTAAHALTKMCSFLCAGAFLHQTGKERLEDLYGIGRKMPVTFACFCLSAMSLVGVPPFIGFFSKWAILSAAVKGEGVWGYLVLAALLISALLTAIYTFTVCIRAFFPSEGRDLYEKSTVREADLRMLLPICLFAALTILSGIFSRQLFSLILSL